MSLQSPRQNDLLAALPDEDYQRILPYLELVSMPLGWPVYEFGGPMPYAYFPTTSMLSLMHISKEGATVELAVTGFEGFVGISLALQGEKSLSRVVVQSAGQAYRLPARIFRREQEQSRALHLLTLRHVRSLLFQVMQTAVCYRHHSLEQQLSRWLLLAVDRARSNRLAMTQELIATMLGVRREGVTEAAGKLQEAGAIRCGRGQITVIDRARLLERSCECYAALRKEAG